MSQEEDKTNDFFDVLAGKVPPNNIAPSSGGKVVGEALRAQIETINASKKARRDDLSVEEKRTMDALKQQLLDKGLIGVVSGTIPSEQPGTGVSRLKRRLARGFDRGWERPLALAASIVFVVAITVLLMIPSDTDIIVRGGATPVVLVSDPKATIDKLTAELRKAGAEIIVVQINEFEWLIRIDVPAAVGASMIQKILLDQDIKIEGAPPYRLSVKKQR